MIEAHIPPLAVKRRGPLLIEIHGYQGGLTMWYFSAQGKSLGSWNPDNGSARVGKEMRRSRDETEVIAWFRALAGEPTC